MMPVFFLSDGYLANGAEPWRIPDVDELPKIDDQAPDRAEQRPTARPRERQRRAGKFLPYKRDERLVRPWAIPGTPGLEHRIGGIEKQDVTGNVNYEPANHEHMVQTRAEKIANIADDDPRPGGRPAPPTATCW